MDLAKADIEAQLVRRADEWIRRAGPKDLLRVLLRGGLTPVIVVKDGHVLTGIHLTDEAGKLSKLGMIWTDLPADESLAIFAQVWGASEPPSARGELDDWMATDALAQDGARRFLRDELEENLALFGSCVDDWLRSTAQPAPQFA